ncbi:aminotransferase class I/II-fold pyridoxal phosphate-dependent enzyme [Chryseobacterium carnipullorum]|uniref:Aminotransferase class I/II-fold pyridoxal phosphate-dependent enzyme n=1 Tax=Chryseobacterium carnipullorum TaxID=1124835 RepID=A0A1M7NL79_CHRCU|nr:aminotransferase class I/II-fold pyridoxal phosphate-dependent enzyme [Chryseobacterium carnipullorum]AZA50970.1 aminotransferase class I/II-fold pyridoxal phosphate-dependent enzyme [Chryseobacterium carnipullorum]AZA65832.1 aminotransferase class I/II-fold pyridoxal phosphate-dependent enzyme [Chryseobacterium carnipullorum]SHN04628.1 methionine-gamma-lyase [Chryseobacterium carnipullorum]STD03463.1 Cystathionine gamma-lyase [Chryseobacterium carnipullorum]HBV15183.1 cystathionine beta-ly
MENFNAANEIQDLQYFGEFGGVNPSISDSSTYTFLSAKTMFDTFEGNAEGCYLYSRHSSPMNLYLAQALAKMENTEAANVTASGMGAITSVLMQVCKSGDHIISSRTIYGGTYAFLKNFLPPFHIDTTFVDISNFESIENAITPNTKVIYCESVSNPLLEVADLRKLSEICKKHNLKLIVDNTFSPLSVSPTLLGADIVIHSLTKFINGSSDTVGGVYCGTQEFINDTKNVNNGACMLLGPTMDSFRSASILKNLRTLHIRMKQHSHNAMYLAERFEKDGLKVSYPGLKSHKDHELMKSMMYEEYGYGGLLTVDAGTTDKANELMEMMQRENLGYLAVSLGFYKTLFSCSGSSTSSEIPEEEREAMGISDGLIRFSIGLDHDIARTYEKMRECMLKTGVLNHETLYIS